MRLILCFTLLFLVLISVVGLIASCNSRNSSARMNLRSSWLVLHTHRCIPPFCSTQRCYCGVHNPPSPSSSCYSLNRRKTAAVDDWLFNGILLRCTVQCSAVDFKFKFGSISLCDDRNLLFFSTRQKAADSGNCICIHKSLNLHPIQPLPH